MKVEMSIMRRVHAKMQAYSLKKLVRQMKHLTERPLIPRCPDIVPLK